MPFYFCATTFMSLSYPLFPLMHLENTTLCHWARACVFTGFPCLLKWNSVEHFERMPSTWRGYHGTSWRDILGATMEHIFWKYLASPFNFELFASRLMPTFSKMQLVIAHVTGISDVGWGWPLELVITSIRVCALQWNVRLMQDHLNDFVRRRFKPVRLVVNDHGL